MKARQPQLPKCGSIKEVKDDNQGVTQSINIQSLGGHVSLSI